MATLAAQGKRVLLLATSCLDASVESIKLVDYTSRRKKRFACADGRGMPGKTGEADRVRVVELYGMLPIETDAELDLDAVWRFHVLAQQYGLSAYDAAYLELAQRRGLGLATVDRSLRTAARKAGITVPRL